MTSQTLRAMAAMSFLGLGFAAACGGSSNEGTPSVPPGNDGGGTGDSGIDSGGNETGARDGGSGDTAPPTKYAGTITLSRTWFYESSGVKGYDYGFTAGFTRTPREPTVTISGSFQQTCQPYQPLSDQCIIQRCVTEPIDSGVDAGVQIAPNAGKIAITGSQFQEVDVQPKADGTYPAWGSSSQKLWSDYGEVTVHGDGADVPAFAISMLGPPDVTVNKPRAAGLISISRNHGLDLAWSGGDNGGVKVRVSILSDAGNRPTSETLACSFDGSAKEGHIPSEILMNLEGAQYGRVWVDVVDPEHVIVGDWAIEATATGDVRGDDGSRYFYEASLE